MMAVLPSIPDFYGFGILVDCRRIGMYLFNSIDEYEIKSSNYYIAILLAGAYPALLGC